jgi:probable F420-dependent oxidoreductase
MKFGVVFPTTEIGNDPAVIRDFAQAAEDLGYESLLAYDHVLGAVHANRKPPLSGPYDEKSPFHEPFVLFGYLAAATRRLELTTGVIIASQRQTALLAKQAAEVQILSQGRLRLGLGTGWNHVEYEALGVDYATRGRRLDEQVRLLRRLWTEPVLDFHGDLHRIDRAGINPLPEQAIPIWLGGWSAPAYRRAARLGDGFIFGVANRAACEALERIRAAMGEAGRKGESFGAETIVDYSTGAEHWRRELAAWQKVGGTHFTIRAMDVGAERMGTRPSGLRTLGERIAALETFMKAVR